MSRATLFHSRDVAPTEHWLDLLRRVEELDSVIVAFSGGVDSTLLVKVAQDVLGARSLAITAVSPSLAGAERDEARELAALIGVQHVEVETLETSDPLYVANTPSRCFSCKSHLFEALETERARRGLAFLAYGAMADDVGDSRPGMMAARERGVVAPLLDAGLGKAEIREASRRLGLPTWNKPQLACLASRIPHGTPVTLERLSAVEAAEAAVRAMGFRQVRVRHHGEVARLEVEPRDVARAEELRAPLTEAVREAGFTALEIDPLGYRGAPLPVATVGVLTP